MKELKKLALILRALGIEANVISERITYKGAPQNFKSSCYD